MSVHVKSGQIFFIPFTNRIKTTGNLGGTAGDDSPVPMEAVTLPLGQGFFIPAGNEPSGHAGMSIWRLPRGSNTPMLASLLV